MTIDTRRATPADVAARNAQDAEAIQAEVKAFAEAVAAGEQPAPTDDPVLLELDPRADLAVIRRLEKFKALAEQVGSLKALQSELRDEILKDITDREADALMVEGSVAARRSVVTSPKIDSKSLRKDFPTIAQRYTTYTDSVRLTVS